MNKLVPLSETIVTKGMLAALHAAMLDQPQVDIPVTHYHVPAISNSPQRGIYARQVFIPAGHLAVGHIHKYQQLNIMVSGEVSIATEEGVFRVKAPYVVVSPAGVKRAVLAHEDTIWLTIHGTDETDVEKIEEMFVTDSYDKYLAFVEQQKQLEDLTWHGSHQQSP